MTFFWLTSSVFIAVLLENNCRSAGKFISGVHWQDSTGVEHTIELLAPGVPETIASLHQRELKNALRWDYTYATCEVCGGTGKRTK
jgi:hypothetical protein